MTSSFRRQAMRGGGAGLEAMVVDQRQQVGLARDLEEIIRHLKGLDTQAAQELIADRFHLIQGEDRLPDGAKSLAAAQHREEIASHVAATAHLCSAPPLLIGGLV